MILVDTSAWVGFFRGNEEARFLSLAIRDNTALLHPYIFGELLLGGLSFQNEALLESLQEVERSSEEDVRRFVKKNALAGNGIGWIDASILHTATTSGYSLATFDEALGQCARNLRVSIAKT